MSLLLPGWFWKSYGYTVYNGFWLKAGQQNGGDYIHSHVTLSTRPYLFTIQWIDMRETSCIIYWIEIDLANSIILYVNNEGQMITLSKQTVLLEILTNSENED